MIPGPPEEFVSWSRIIAGLGSVFLSGLLVILYKKQQEQLAAQHEAVLEVTDVEWYDDKAIIWISNFGNGVAKNLFLTTLVKADNNEHREYTIRHNALKRIDTGGEWGNHIRPDEEDIAFTGQSKVGQPAPETYPGDWVSLKFSPFVRRAKENGATQVKYLHLIQGTEASDERSAAAVNEMTRSVNPQDFDYENSLGNLPSFTQHGRDMTFQRYLRESLLRDIIYRIYIHCVRFVDLVTPKIVLRPRAYDASGTNRVKRVLLKRQLTRSYSRLKSSAKGLIARVARVIRENWKILI